MHQATKSRFISLLVFLLLVILPSLSSASDDDITAVGDVVYAWQKALTDRNMDAHLFHYDASYPLDVYPNSVWLGEKKVWAEDSAPFSITVSEPDVRIEGGIAVADFVETFKRLSTSAIGKKRLKLAREEDRWRIISEEWVRYIFEMKLSPLSEIPLEKEGGLRISIVEYTYESKQPEKVCVTLDRFVAPEVIALEGEKPRVAIDFENTPPVEKHRDIRSAGFLIQKIRTHYHQDKRKLRMVLDLNPLEDFQVDPVFYKAENQYCLTVSRSAGLEQSKTE